MSTEPKLSLLFPTPIFVIEVPDSATLNAELRQVITEREKSQPSTQISNLGGWQSSWDMDRWGGAPAIKLMAIIRNLANRMTTDRKGTAGTGPHPGFYSGTWGANMWANVNRSGHGNVYHSHPGAYWSAVYYVDDGGIDADPSLGGELEFMDPRGPLPTMNSPHLGYAGPGGLSGGNTEIMRPKNGMMVMFPSWLLHQVRPYLGTRERISIAFNLHVLVPAEVSRSAGQAAAV